MKNIEFKLRQEDDHIKLGQLLKACDAVSNGGEAKIRIIEGEVKVNGSVEKQRGKKIKAGDKIEIDDMSINVIK